MFERSNQRALQSPRLALAPADGVLQAGAALPGAAFAPENPAMRLPHRFPAYLGGGVAFQLDRLERSGDGGMVLDLRVPPNVQ